MRKRTILLSGLAASLSALYVSIATKADPVNIEIKQQRMEELMRQLPDSVFEDVKSEDLLNDEVYLKLAHDGWTSREIMTIMETAVKDKKKAKEKFGYGYYAKQWRPTYGRSLGDDTLYQFVDTGMPAMRKISVLEAVGENDYNRTWPVEAYSPLPRRSKDYRPDPGNFRQVRFNPSSGRVHWIVANQCDTEGKQIYAIPDNAGIFKSDNGGETWTCITDNIPDRADRSYSPGYSLPVDPKNWDHLFAFMVNSSVYETTDGGNTWRKIEGATHKNFKRGYCFRDSKDRLKFIGCQPDGNSGKLWISQDTCKTWTQVPLPSDFREEGSNNFWFQQVAFDPTDHDKIYFPGSRSILYMDDGACGTVENGKIAYTLKRLTFNVTGKDNEGNLRDMKSVCYFPFDGTSPGFMEIHPKNGKLMYFAGGNRESGRSCLYVSEDGGHNWETLNEIMYTDATNPADLKKNFGSGTVFGNEAPWNWLGGFGVEYDPSNVEIRPNRIFGCTMSSAYSVNGGRDFKEYAWGTRQKSLITEGLTNPSGATNSKGYYYVSASRHNADNHGIFSHVSGKVFRFGDGGFFVHDPSLSGEGKAVGEADWVNISSNLGQMLFYNVRVNEFGDQAIIGNTQDIDVQTYRYGRWGHWRGYEGCEASFNPYTSSGYFSGGGGGFSPVGMNPDSWHTARNYADVVTGDWFMLRTWNGDNTRSTLFRVEDIGASLTDLYGAIGQRVTNVALCRDGGLTVFIKTADNAISMSTDSCKTFVPLYAANGNKAVFSNTQMTCDPNNRNILYLGQNNGKVLRYKVKEGTWEPCGNGLPAKVVCNRLLFHEGSGDLYYVDYSTGIYMLKNGDTQWRFWTRGYNNAKFNDCDINYTTQEMVISDYGRGVWVADLETPSSRYFKDGSFTLKEISHRDGVRMFGIDTEWTIPLYYNYRWFVDGKPVEGNPYQYLVVKDTETIGTIKLELSLREAPYVTATSKEYDAAADKMPEVTIERHQGNAIYSTGAGRVDVGYMDWFHDDFTVDLWVNPSSDGVILSNSQVDVEKGAKGWSLYIESGVLKFKYYPSNVLQQPTYEVTMDQSHVITGAPIAKNRWSHVAITQKRHDNITLYINGEIAGQAPRIRATEEHSLNNSVIMSLFGDSFEQRPLEGSVDELKVWKEALDINKIRMEMFSTNLGKTDGLVAYYDFNGECLEDNEETFTGYIPRSRTRAITEARRMTVPVSADYVSATTLKDGVNKFVSVDTKLPLVDISGKQGTTGTYTVVYGYAGDRWENPDDNLSEAYYEPTQYGYMIRTFGNVDSEAMADITFHNGNDKFVKGTGYRLYMADNAQDRMYWKQYKGKIEYTEGNLTLKDTRLADIVDRKLMLVTMKPAIELEIEGLSADGRIVLYDDGNDRTKYNFVARLIENKTVPGNRYEIMSDSAVLVLPTEPLSFDNNKEARGTMEVDVDMIGDFGSTISTFIRGKNDDDMIPIPVDILNRITPNTLNNPLEIKKGCVRFGTATDFARMKGINNFTLMGWVRVDDPVTITTGRNGDHVAPLMFFRNATGGDNNATGIHLRNGNVGYHWNDQNWSYNATTKFTITESDLGKWVHLALVVKPDGAWIYFNGMEEKMPGTSSPMPLCIAQSPLLLGTNTQGNYSYFSGAFDHVAVWTRALSAQEVRKYMHNRVLLNDSELLAYITMDEMDESGKYYKESLQGFSSNNHYGTVSTGEATPIPFAPFISDVALSSASSPIRLSTEATGYISAYEGYPYNYIAAGEPEQLNLPLNPYYYTLVYDKKQEATNDYITMTYNFEGLIDGETVAIGIRDLGSLSPFTNLIEANTVSNGTATFTVPASKLLKSSEIMFFSTPESSHRPTIVRMAFRDAGLENGAIYLVDNNDNEIDVDITVVSGNDEVRIVPKENYVRVSSDKVDMTDASQMIKMTIDTDELRKTNPFGLSDVTLNLNGTTAEPLTLRVGLKPKVELKLKNGVDDTHFVAKTPVSTLDIEADLKEGYLAEPVRLTFTPKSINSAFNISNGSLLLNEDVTVSALKHSESSDGGYYAGWNLIGNPYLMNINLTKHQNYGYEENAMTHFVYHTIDGSDNIMAFDMTDYDDLEHILPFQSYYVQMMKDDSDFTVKKAAKETTTSRKTFDYYTAIEVKAVTLKLLDENNKEIDRTTVRWEEDAVPTFQINEDAPKLHSVNGLNDELYTLTQDGKAVSINYQPSNVSGNKIPLAVNFSSEGKKLVVSRLTGFSGEQGENGKEGVYLVNEVSNDKTPLRENMEIPVASDDKFHLTTIFKNDVPTGIEDLADGRTDYRIYPQEGNIRVTGLQGDAAIYVYSVSGLLVVSRKTAEPELVIPMERGVYAIRIRENGKDYVTKIIVK